MEDVAGRGMTVLVSSHNLRELEDVCDHVGIMHKGKMLLERSLDALQENIVKVQLVTEHPLPEGLNILHKQTVGRIHLLPLSLEEIFIYELGGVDYDIKNIVL